MKINENTFFSGMTTDEYLAQIKVNKQPFLDIYASVEIPDVYTSYLESLDESLKLVAFTADWCGDHLTTSPPILRLSQATDRLEARVFDSDLHKEMTNSFLPENRWNTVPVFVVFDSCMNEVCRFIETSNDLVPELDAMESIVINQHVTSTGENSGDNDIIQESQISMRGGRTAIRVANAREWGTTVLHSFVQIIKEGLALSEAERPAVGGTRWPF